MCSLFVFQQLNFSLTFFLPSSKREIIFICGTYITKFPSFLLPHILQFNVKLYSWELSYILTFVCCFLCNFISDTSSIFHPYLLPHSEILSSFSCFHLQIKQERNPAVDVFSRNIKDPPLFSLCFENIFIIKIFWDHFLCQCVHNILCLCQMPFSNHEIDPKLHFALPNRVCIIYVFHSLNSNKQSYLYWERIYFP